MGYVTRNIERTNRNGKDTKTIIKYVTDIKGQDGTKGEDSFSAYITPNTRVFEATNTAAVGDQFDVINVFAFRGSQQISAKVGNIEGTIPYAIDASISNNGTTRTSVTVTVSNRLVAPSGTLTIPVMFNASAVDSSTEYNPSYWDASVYDIVTQNCVYSWGLAKAGGDAYVLDLSNENANINCDSSGNILPTAVKPTCDAHLLLNGVVVPGAEYSISYPSTQSVTGVSIDSSSGHMTFANNFNFTGNGLEITVHAELGTSSYGEKVMTITKSFPGAGGQDAVSYWLELSTDTVKVNPNASSPSATPSTVTATAKKQIGGNDPVTATEAVIKYSFNSTTATTTYTGPISIDISKTYLRIEMFVNGKWQDGETIPIMYDGKNGTSAYVLDLSNQAATINADSNGNILSAAVRPTCKATLYYGSIEASGVTYSLSYPSGRGVQGVSINASTGQLTFNAGTASTPFSFSGLDLELTVTAKIGTTLCGTTIMTISKSCAGQNGQNGQNGADGVDGKDGTSIVWKGNYSSHPANPENGWAYYNTTNHKSYTYRDGTWYQMTIDGVDGANGKDGKDGLDIVWKGESATPPANPQKNWCYRDTNNGYVYIYNGSSWALMTHDGSDGTDGTNGSDGLSVFITYHDNPATSTPSTPTGSGTSGGWHTNPTNASVWMSQKIAASASSGTWGAPIRIKGTDGTNGVDGSDGVDGKDGTSIVWKGSYSSHPSGAQNGWAYYNTTNKKSYTYRDGTWYQMTVDGVNGANGKDGKDGLDIVWKGDSTTPPANPQKNWCYRDTNNGRVYIYNGSAWALMTHDGSDGEDGANGSDGLSVFITYHDNSATSTPATPTGSGTSGGWHTNPTNASVWMSQKVAASASSGTWGTPVRIKGTDGANGRDGSDGSDGVSYWMTLSADAIHVNKNGTMSPSTITASKYKQIGGNSPVTASDCTIKYGYDTQSPSTTYSSAISVNKNHSYIAFGMYLGSTLVDGIEIVPILVDGVDGKDGKDGTDGRDGADGDRGPSTVFRGEYNSATLYYANPRRIDIVKYNGSYYMTRAELNRSFSNIAPTNSGYWTEFGGIYENIATGFMFAEEATIENAVIRKLRTSETGKRVTAENNALSMYDTNNNLRLSVSGENLGSVPSGSTYQINAQTMFSVSRSDYQINAGGQETFSEKTILSSFTVSSGATNVVEVEVSFLLSGSGGVIRSGELNFVCPSINVCIDGVSQSGAHGVFLHATPGDSYDQTTATVRIQTTVPAGTHRLSVKGDYAWYCGSGSIQTDYGSGWTFTLAMNATAYLYVRYPMQKMEIGANGFRAMYDSDQKFEAIKDPNTSKISFQMVNGQAGVRVEKDRLYIKYLSSWYEAYREYNSTLGGYYLKIANSATSL